MSLLTRFALVAQVLCPVLAIAADSPPSLPHITSVQYSGSGCPNNAARSGDFNSPTFKYNDFAAASPGTNQTLNCEVHLQASGGSTGWQVALSQVNINGHLVLDPGMNLDYYTQAYYSQDAANTGSVKNTISNNTPNKIDRSVTINQAISNKVYSQCIGADGSPGILNVNFRTVLGGSGQGFFEVLTENLNFVWRKC